MAFRFLDALLVESLGRSSTVELRQILIGHLFDKQLAVLHSTEKTEALLCGRRSGKTVLLVVLLLLAALDHPGEIALYVVWRRAQIRTTIWAEAKRIVKRYALPITFRETDRQFYIDVPGGGCVWLTGCDDLAEVEKFRGGRFSMAAVDEMGSYADYLQSMIEDAIEPALSDLGGRLLLCGTPGMDPIGYWHSVSSGADPDVPQLPTNDWTCLDNPHHDSADWVARITLEQLAERFPAINPERDQLAIDRDGMVLIPGPRLAKRGWGPTHPTFLREWCNRWVTDREALAYPFDPDRNFVDSLPEGEFRRILSIDLGASAERPTTAFVLLAYQIDLPAKYIEHSEKRAGQTPASIEARIEWYRSTWWIDAVVVDAGGLGGAYVQQFRDDGLPAEAAEKRNKRAFHEFCRGDILAGTLKLCLSNPGYRDLMAEARAVTIEDLAEDIGVDHLLDGVLYAWRRARTAYQGEREDPKPGDRDYDQWEREQRKAAAKARVMAARKPKPRW